jgi:hypothetical protein
MLASLAVGNDVIVTMPLFTVNSLEPANRLAQIEAHADR